MYDFYERRCNVVKIYQKTIEMNTTQAEKWIILQTHPADRRPTASI